MVLVELTIVVDAFVQPGSQPIPIGHKKLHTWTGHANFLVATVLIGRYRLYFNKGQNKKTAMKLQFNNN